MKCDSYLLDQHALALEPSFLGEHKSKITTTNGIYFSKMLPKELLEAACVRFSSTLEGRTKAVQQLLNFSRKTPFLISPFDIAVFPIMSSRKIDCVWIFNHRFKVDEYEKGRSNITFNDGTTISVEVSEYILRKQQHRLHTVIDTFRAIYKEGK